MHLSGNMQQKRLILAYQQLSLLLILQCLTIMMVPFQSCMSSKSLALLQGSTENKLAKSWTTIGNAMLAERAQISQESEERNLETIRKVTVTIWKHLKDHSRKLEPSRTELAYIKF